MLHKLKYYGIEGTALRPCESYLNGRQQHVDLDGSNSNYNRILTGVPQGSILGPLLFVIHYRYRTINNRFKFIIYADDATLCSTLKINAGATQINMELNNMSQWLNMNKLSLNVKKSNGFSHATKENNTTKYINRCVKHRICGELYVTWYYN